MGGFCPRLVPQLKKRQVWIEFPCPAATAVQRFAGWDRGGQEGLDQATLIFLPEMTPIMGRIGNYLFRRIGYRVGPLACPSVGAVIRQSAT